MRRFKVGRGDLRSRGLKRCFKCQEAKPIDDFYSNLRMRDGHLNKCIDCSRKDAARRRAEKPEWYIAYEAKRRQAKGAPVPRELSRKALLNRAWKNRNPQKYAAHIEVTKAIRQGTIIRCPCVVCGNLRSQAHHEDYNRPFDVTWLCQKHHKARHKEIRERAIAA